MQLRTPREIADELHQKPKTIQEWIRKGLLPAYRVNRRYLISEAQVQAFLSKQQYRPL